MGKISINLLPPELKLEEKKKSKKAWVVRLTILAVFFVIIVTAVAFGFGIFKKTEHRQFSANLENARKKVASLNENEGYLTLIRDHLSTIDKLRSSQSQVTSSFQLIFNLVPSGVSVQSVSIDGGKLISLSGESNSVDSLSLFLDNLTISEKNEGKIAKVTVNNLAKAKDSLKFDLSTLLK